MLMNLFFISIGCDGPLFFFLRGRVYFYVLTTMSTSKHIVRIENDGFEGEMRPPRGIITLHWSDGDDGAREGFSCYRGTKFCTSKRLCKPLHNRNTKNKIKNRPN